MTETCNVVKNCASPAVESLRVKNHRDDIDELGRWTVYSACGVHLATLDAIRSSDDEEGG